MGLGLTMDARALVRVLAGARREGVRVAELTAAAGWDDTRRVKPDDVAGFLEDAAQRTVQALGELLAPPFWAVIEDDRAILLEWAVYWETARVKRGRRLPYPERVAMRGDRDETPVMYGIPAQPWRELHPKSCSKGCRACWLKISATKPPPRGDCLVCGGSPREGWICGSCHREG